MNLAVKDIQHSLGRFLLTTVGVGLLLIVVMGMRGVLRGSEEDATFIVDNVGADLWVVQGETRGPFAELSKIPANLRDRVATVPGVKSARQCVFFTMPYFPRRVLLHEADLMQLAGVVAGMCLVGSVLGIWRAARVSPNEVLS